MGKFNLMTKIEIMIVGSTSPCEITQIEMTNSGKYMESQIILPTISFTVCVQCIFQHVYVSLVLC